MSIYDCFSSSQRSRRLAWLGECGSLNNNLIGVDVLDIIKELHGVNGQIYLYKDKVIIERKGFIAKITQGFFNGDKSIYLAQISGIRVQLGSLLSNGYIQFNLAGGIENTVGLREAPKDENTVMFKKKENDLVTEIKALIEKLKIEASKPSSVQVSAADEIRKYKQLLEDGIISNDDFEKKKAQLLNE